MTAQRETSHSDYQRRMAGDGATATSSAVAGNVRFKAAAELASMAEMGAKRSFAAVCLDVLYGSLCEVQSAYLTFAHRP